MFQVMEVVILLLFSHGVPCGEQRDCRAVAVGLGAVSKRTRTYTVHLQCVSFAVCSFNFCLS
jgi:hypothetical protein